MISPEDVAVLDLNSEELGIVPSFLMDRAGQGLAAHLKVHSRLIFFLGSGNNGGDGLVAARYLKDRNITVVLAKGPKDIKTLQSREAFRVLPDTIKVVSWKEFNMKPHEISSSFDVIVDGLLGSGAKGEPRSPYREIIELINSTHLPVVSIDIPTGIGTGICVDSDKTVTFHDIKDNMTGCRNVSIIDIGIPADASRYVGKGDLLRIPKKATNFHKGKTGKVLIIGGGPFTGAPIFSSLAVIGTGADLVRTAVPSGIWDVVATSSPEIIVERLDTKDPYKLGPEVAPHLKESIRWAHSVLIGPGAGISGESIELMEDLISFCLEEKKPLVIDADGIKAARNLRNINSSRVLLTPHKRELMDVLGNHNVSYFKRYLDDPIDGGTGRWKMGSMDPVVKFTLLTGADLLVKGSIDMIATSHDHSLNEHISHRSIHVRYNKTGVPEMSVGGTGDVLAGLCAGFMAKGMTAFDSGCLAAYVNGKAGELTKKKIGISLSASKILDQLSSVLSSS